MEDLSNILAFGHVGFSEVIALFVAVVLGGAIGFEREMNGKPAGLRTNMIICLGAAAFTIIAIDMARDSDGATRVIQGVITGVGFLGAGALIHAGSDVQGLTTAASIWLVTSIGIACGAGMYIIAATVTVLALIALLGFLPLTRWLRRKNQRVEDVQSRRKEDTLESNGT